MEIFTRAIESPLGRWIFAEWRPGHLAGLVESIWYFDGTVAQPRERVFPCGIVEIILHLGDRYRLVDGRESSLCSPACLTGVQKSPIVIEAPGRHCRVMGVRLHPIGTYAILGVAVEAVTGLTIDLAELGGPEIADLVERCEAAPSLEERFRIVARWVATRLARARWEAEPAIAWIAGEIERRAGIVSISALQERAGLSKNRLLSGFREQVGVTPKLFARIHRFRNAMSMLHQGVAPLSRVALDAGYYDQAHMNAEFRELGGLTPLEFVRSARYPGSSSLAEPGN